MVYISKFSYMSYNTYPFGWLHFSDDIFLFLTETNWQQLWLKAPEQEKYLRYLLQ